MVYGRVALLLLLLVPATLAGWRNSHPRRSSVKKGDDSCKGLEKLVQAVQDEVSAIDADLGGVASDVSEVLSNQDDLKLIGVSLKDGQDQVRNLTIDIKSRQDGDQDSVLAAVADVEKTLRGEVEGLESDVQKLHAGQKTLQSSLESTTSDLSEEQALIMQGLTDAEVEHAELTELLNEIFSNTEEVKGSVAELSDRLGDLETCLKSKCRYHQ